MLKVWTAYIILQGSAYQGASFYDPYSCWSWGYKAYHDIKIEQNIAPKVFCLSSDMELVKVTGVKGKENVRSRPSTSYNGNVMIDHNRKPKEPEGDLATGILGILGALR